MRAGAPAMLQAGGGPQPYSLEDFSGVAWATSSISMPPALRRHKDDFGRGAVKHQAEVELAVDGRSLPRSQRRWTFWRRGPGLVG